MAGSSSHFQYRSPFGDTTLTKVFVGGLAWETPTEKLQEYFAVFGEIREAVIITDKNTGKSKGYGFVTFRDPESAKRAVEDANPMIDGRRANCNIAASGRPRQQPPQGGGQGQSGQMSYPGAEDGSSNNTQGLMVAPVQMPPMYPSYGYTAYSPQYSYNQAAAAAMYHQQLQQARYFQHLYGSGASANSPTIQPPHHPFYYTYSMQVAAAAQRTQGPYVYYSSPPSPPIQSPSAGSYSSFHQQSHQQQDLPASSDSSRLQQLPSQIESHESSRVTSPETEVKVVPSESSPPSD